MIKVDTILMAKLRERRDEKRGLKERREWLLMGTSKRGSSWKVAGDKSFRGLKEERRKEEGKEVREIVGGKIGY